MFTSWPHTHKSCSHDDPAPIKLHPGPQSSNQSESESESPSSVCPPWKHGPKCCPPVLAEKRIPFITTTVCFSHKLFKRDFKSQIHTVKVPPLSIPKDNCFRDVCMLLWSQHNEHSIHVNAGRWGSLVVITSGRHAEGPVWFPFLVSVALLD